MSENIGKLTTPNNDGASIEVDSNLIKINNPLEFDYRGKIRYDPNQKWFAIQDHYPDGDLDKGPFILLADGDKYPEDHTNNYQNGAVTLCARSKGESNKTVLAIIQRKTNNLTLNNIIDNVSTISIIDSILRQGNNYIQYTSGLLICQSPVIAGDEVVTYPIPFIELPALAFGYMANDVVNARMGYAINYSNTGFTCKIRNIIGGDLVTQSDISYIAIGRWK